MPLPTEPRPERLQKVMARAGIASRRSSEKLIRAGRVSVNGVVADNMGMKVVAGVDEILVDGRPLELPSQPAYIALNKPQGFITSVRDPQGRPTVMELLPADVPGLFPVGRLDMDSEGLLLAMTDGELGHRLTHPRFHVEKTYEVLADGRVADEALERLRSGVELDDGMTLPADVELLDRSKDRTLLAVTLKEGRKRQVRRMLSFLGHPVLRLIRTSFGPVPLEGIGAGGWRSLTGDEVAALKSETGME